MTAVLTPATDTRRPARRLLPMALIFLAVGTSTAMVGPFLTLFLTDAVHAASWQVTAFLIAAPLSSVTVSTVLGRLSDRYPIRRQLIIAAALAGASGTLATSMIRNYWALLALTVTATAAAGSLVPQLFAYVRTTLAGSDRAAMTTSSLRTLFSLSWVAGPFVATVLLGLGGFRVSYSVSCAMYLTAAVIAWRLLPAAAPAVHSPPPSEAAPAPPTSDSLPLPATSPASPDPRSLSPAPLPAPSDSLPLSPVASPAPSDSCPLSPAASPAAEAVSAEPGLPPYLPEPAPAGSPAAPSPSTRPLPAGDAPRRVIFLTVAAFALMQCASGLGVQAMSLFVTTDLGGGIGSAGVILGVCAALEIPLMLGFGYLSTRVPLRRLVLAGPLFSMAYTLTVASSTHVWQVAGAQLFAACTVSVVQGLGVSYVQEMLPRHPGRASTLFTNAFPAGQMMAGPILGVAQHVGYRAAYLTAAVLALVAFIVLKLARSQP
jgi:SET family sugar efflux transporter-like MFS transporter